jgi:hypothetical protein
MVDKNDRKKTILPSLRKDGRGGGGWERLGKRERRWFIVMAGRAGKRYPILLNIERRNKKKKDYLATQLLTNKTR